MTSQDRLLALHEAMVDSRDSYFKHLSSFRGYKPVLIIAVVVLFIGGIGSYFGLTVGAEWTTKTLTLFGIALFVIPLALMSRAFDKRKFKPLLEESNEDTSNYLDAVHRVIIAHGFSGIVAQNDPREGHYQCYASKDGAVSTITASVYDNAVVLKVEEETNVLMPFDSEGDEPKKKGRHAAT